jgi:hypothetical protein
MALLQIEVNDKLKKAIQKKAETYGVSASAIVRIVLIKSFSEQEVGNLKEGNIFNAERDNNGKGIAIDDLINAL